MPGINLEQLKNCVIMSVHNWLGAPWNSESALVLSLGTAIHESNAGEYLSQIGGPALGPWQMEPETHDDCWENFLAYRPALSEGVSHFRLPTFGGQQMAWNLAYACAMARVKYIRAEPPLPAANDFVGMANYYKQFYNSSLGAAIVGPELIDCFSRALAA